MTTPTPAGNPGDMPTFEATLIAIPKEDAPLLQGVLMGAIEALRGMQESEDTSAEARAMASEEIRVLKNVLRALSDG
jgi:hypothetical protein